MNAHCCLRPLLALLLITGVAAAAEDDLVVLLSGEHETPMQRRLADLEARLAEYENRLEAVNVRQASCLECAPLCPTRQHRDCWTRPCPGVFADAELLLLQWSDTDGDDRQSQATSGSRYTLGYMNSLGRAFRMRYFEFSIDDAAGGGALQTERLDMEYAGRFTLGHNWQGELSLGARWASLSNPTPRQWNDTWGPVLGIGLRSELCDWLALYGGARHSLQFGDEAFEAHDHHIGVTELALGAELKARARSAELFLRTGVEAQQYSSVRDDEEDYGLVGWTMAIGFRR